MSARKVREAMFTATAHQGGVYWHNIDEVVKFCAENIGEDLDVILELSAVKSKKLKMYGYFHKVILHCAVIGYTAAGYSGVDKVKAKYMLMAEFARDYVIKPNGEPQVIVMEMKSMSHARLHKLLSDCIFFIEDELQQGVPSSEDYKMKRDTGINFKASRA